MTTITSLDAFSDFLDLTAEAKSRLSRFDALFLKTAKHHNLVARSTLEDRWNRHYLDSAQLYNLLPEKANSEGGISVLDLGSGAGFPGLVLAAMGAEDFKGRRLEVTLVESTGKKANFLLEAGKAMDLPMFHVKQTRIEKLRLGKKPDVITARALASLNKLCDYSSELMGPNTQCFFMKGARGPEELVEAKQYWNMETTEHASMTSEDAVIYQISNLKRRV